MYIVGLTGPIAAGKTTIAERLEEKGAIVISADRIGHDLLHKKEIKAKIKKEFGENVFEDDHVDRKKLAKIVFRSRESLDDLNKIMWPPITKIIDEELKLYSQKLPSNEIIILDVALLLEAGLDKSTNMLVAVTSEREKQLERLMAKNHTKEQAEARMKMQTPKNKLLKQSDYTIENNSSLDSLKKETEKLWHFIKKHGTS